MDQTTQSSINRDTLIYTTEDMTVNINGFKTRITSSDIASATFLSLQIVDLSLHMKEL